MTAYVLFMGLLTVVLVVWLVAAFRDDSGNGPRR